MVDTIRYQAEIFLPYGNPLTVSSVLKSGCRIKRTQSWKPQARWSCLFVATSTRRGAAHTRRSKRYLAKPHSPIVGCNEEFKRTEYLN